MTYLVPTESKKRKNGSVNTWLFSKGEERWMRLAEDATECNLSYKRDKFGSIGEMTVACK